MGPLMLVFTNCLFKKFEHELMHNELTLKNVLAVTLINKC